MSKTVEKDEERIGVGFGGANCWLPGSGVPRTACGGQDRNGFAPSGEFGRRSVTLAPPESRGFRRRGFGNPDAREYGFKMMLAWNDAEIEELAFGGSKDFVPGPVGAAILALGVAVHEIVFVIGAGDIPELPFSVVKQDVGFVDAAALPRFAGGEGGGRLIEPSFAVPLQIADRVRAPKLFGGAGVVDALDPGAAMWIPTLDVGGAVAAPVLIPCGAATASGE